MLRFLIVAMIVLLLPSANNASASTRVALVIGNSAYQHATPLSNPKNDAADMSQKLTAMGFDVVQGLDKDLVGLRNSIRDFVGRLDRAEIALFFYAGHGMQVNGENFIIPIDAKLNSFIDLEFEAVPMNLILSAMERTTKVNLIFLDACRDNPLAQNLARSMGTRSGSVGRGLARLGSGVGSLISFATQPGNVALDGNGRNSPFTTALLKHLGTPGQDIAKDLVHVRRDVLDTTGGKQVPWENSSLTGEVVLVPSATSLQSEAVVPPPKQQSQGQIPAIGGQMELSFWESIKDAEVKELYEAYLEKFPQGTFAGIARVKIEMLEAPSSQKASRRERTGAPAEEVNAELAAEKVDNNEKGSEIAALSTDEISSSVTVLPTPISDLALIKNVQTELVRLGCLSGRIDGKWGSQSTLALEKFARLKEVRLSSTEPSADVLNLLKLENSRVCPLQCRAGHMEKNGLCIKVEQEVNKSQQNKNNDRKLTKPKTTNLPAKTKKAASQSKNCYKCTSRSGSVYYELCTDGDPKSKLSGTLRTVVRCSKL